MKKLALILALGMMYQLLTGQTVNYVEYFWDNDPGVGNGVGTSIAAGQLVNETISVDPSGLSAGPHLLGVRTRNSDNEWSVPIISRVVLNELVAVEYFWDEDPGVGNGNAVAISTTDNAIDEDINISSAGVSPGLHELGIRTKGVGGIWSPVTWKTVRVSTTFQDGEYYWDNDPGVGNGFSFSLPNDIDTLNASVSISTFGIDPGWHNLYTRIRGVNGSYGMSVKQRVYVARAIVGGEYFWDTDPGVGNGEPLGTITIGTSAQVCDEVSTVGLSEGEHYLYVRSVSEDGVWSIPTRIQMTVTPNEIVVGCPGDFDRNGFVSSGDLLVFLSGFGNSGDCTVDLNGDFVVNAADFLIFVGLIGDVCE